MREPEVHRDPLLAVALEYDGNGAPRVTAKGIGDVAEAIVALAQGHDIPTTGDRHLARLLSQLDLGEEIPESLYQVVAEVLAFAYLLRGRMPENHGAADSPAATPDPAAGAAATPDPPPPRSGRRR